jgi:hypothetical protein
VDRFSVSGVEIAPFERRVRDAVSRILASIEPQPEISIVIDEIANRGTYPHTEVQVTFHEPHHVSGQFGWRARLWDWERDPLRDVLKDDPEHLADMLVSNLEEQVFSDDWDKYSGRVRDETIWLDY